MHTARIQHLKDICTEQHIDGFLISSSSNIFYLSGFNRFLVDHDGFLLVTPTQTYLITSPLYTQAVKKFTPHLEILETSADLWYAQVVKKIIEQQKLHTIGFEEKDLRVAEYFDLQDEKVTLKSVSLRNLRLQKDADEIDAIQKACALTDETFKHVLAFVKEGITELQLAEKMQQFLKTKNADIGFPTIVAFGQHAAVPHHMTSDAMLQKNSFILFDFGVKYNNYLSDMSRTVFFGKPTSQQKRLYDTVKKSQEKAVAYIEQQLSIIPAQAGHNPLHGGIQEKEMDPGSESGRTIPDIFTKDVDRIARDVIEKEKFPVYPHALGHGVGLEVHEAPTLSVYSPEKLVEHTVFTIEPGIYEPSMGGVRIEDVFVIANHKLTQLTHSSKELIVL